MCEKDLRLINGEQHISILMIILLIRGPKNLPSGETWTKFFKMLLHYLNLSIEIEKLSDKAAAAIAVKVLLGQWIELL